MPASVLIRGGQVYDHDGDVHHPLVADVLVEGDTVVAVGPGLDVGVSDTVDATGKLIVPGLINAHYHSHDTLCRGLFEELTLEMWLLYTLPMGANRSKEEVRARTLVGAVECLRNGITTVQDMLGLVPLTEEHSDAVIAAYRESGIRVVYSPMVWDVPPIAMVRHREDLPADIQDMLGTEAAPAGEQLQFVKEQIRRHPAEGTLHWALAPFAPQRCTPQMLEACAQLSQEHELPVYTHAYETRGQVLIARELFADHGGSLITYLRDVGLLTPRLNVVHGVWLTRPEMDRMAEAQAGVVLNHLSNLKLKSGVAPILELLDSGVRLGLGCDNCSGSDVQSMFQAMKMFCLLAAVSDPEPGLPLAGEALHRATLGNARTAGLDDRLGAIRPGYKADLVLLDLDDVSYVPYNSAVRQLVYTESGRGVHSVMVDGRMVIDDGNLTTVDETALREEIAGLLGHFIEDYDDIVRSRKRAIPFMLNAHRRVWEQDVGMNRFVGQSRF